MNITKKDEDQDVNQFNYNDLRHSKKHYNYVDII